MLFMRPNKATLFLSAVLWAPVCSMAQTIPWGTWVTFDDHTGAATSYVKVVETDQGLMGSIDRILDPAKADARCTACEDGRKDQPITGMVIFQNVKAKEDEALTWDGGEILDPKNGRTYKVRIRLIEDGKTLEVRGYKGSPMFGRTQVWRRLDDAAATQSAPAASSAAPAAAGSRP